MSVFLNSLGRNTFRYYIYIYMWKKKRKVRSNLRVIQFKSYSPGSSKKEHEGSGPQALRWCCKAVFLKEQGIKRGRKDPFAASSTRCPATDLEKLTGGTVSQMFHTYRDDGHSTWDQCWNVACKIQLAAEVSWCCQPESYCKVPLWKRRWKIVEKGCLCGPKFVDLSLAAAWQESTRTHTAFHLTVKCHHHNPTPDPLSPPASQYLRYI